MASTPSSVADMINMLAGLKDHGVMINGLPLMIDISTDREPVYVAAEAEFVRDENTGDKWLVFRPKPAGA